MPGQYALYGPTNSDVSVDSPLTLTPKLPLADVEIRPVDLGSFAVLLVDPNVSVCSPFVSHTPQLLLVLHDLPRALEFQLLPNLQV